MHRDLKPANIMIDGRGQVLIADFGIAGLAGQVQGDEIRNGTPAYMAPEQLDGKEVSVASDIYALGLVFYEMFTGRRAFEDPARRTAPARAITLVPDIDAAVDRLITRCLEEDPRARPRSALAVAASLPGGDPLADALAAGETPSPEMVAAAGETEGPRVRTLLVCLALILTGLPVAIWLHGKVNILQQTPFEKSPEVLAQKAREVIRAFGYSSRPADSSYGFDYDADYGRYANDQEKIADVRVQLAKGQPPFIEFWYRDSPRNLSATSSTGIVSAGDPPENISGMFRLFLDPQGRLLAFEETPPQVEARSGVAGDTKLDAAPLFTAAGLDLDRFTPVEPEWTPATICDARRAWIGFHPDAPSVPLRLEAAFWRGRPVYVNLIGPWSRPHRMQESPQKPGQEAYGWMLITLITVVFSAAAYFAWRNYSRGKGDRRGSARIFAFVLCCSMLTWACRAKHNSGFAEFNQFTLALGVALFSGSSFGVLYLALEPYVRRRWPQSLISWSRLLAGAFRDPVVGGQTLIGIAWGIESTIVLTLNQINLGRYRALPESIYGLQSILGARQLVAVFLESLAHSLQGLFLFFLFVVLRVLLRREWLACLVSQYFWVAF